MKDTLDSLDTVIISIAQGVGGFLSKICSPAAEEFGLLLRDRVSYWRLMHLKAIVEKAERKMGRVSRKDMLKAHPRIVARILDHGSWADTDDLHEMWAGLLVSSCTKGGKDDSNLLFVNLLAQLSSSEVRIINYACLKSGKYRGTDGITYASHLAVPFSDLQKEAQLEDPERCIRELEHLMSMGLLESWHKPMPYTSMVNLTPSLLALQLFVRCQGVGQSPAEYFQLSHEHNGVESNQARS